MRLNKYLGESGAWSRRGADELIAARRVMINGRVAGLGDQVAPGDEVKVDGQVVGGPRKRDRPVYIALNKPVGITCTTERHVEGNIIDFVDHEERVFPIGRLDKDSQGLILLTNDGDVVNEVLRAEHGHEKEYVVTVDRLVTDEFVARMAGGVQLSDALTRRCKVRRLGPRVIDIILTQGLNRQIRRMCAALGYEVVKLERIRIMDIHLGALPIGRWRDLTAEEVAGLWVRGTPAPGAAGAGASRPSPPPRGPGGARGAPARGPGGPPVGRASPPPRGPGGPPGRRGGEVAGGAVGAVAARGGEATGGPRRGAGRAGWGAARGPRAAPGRRGGR